MGILHQNKKSFRKEWLFCFGWAYVARETLWFDRMHFCGAKAPLFLHAMQKTQENAIGTEQAKLAEYPAYRSTFFSRKTNAFFMRPAPDLTQTGAKTRWIYRDLFDKTARIFLERYKSNPASGGQFMPTCGVLPMDFPVVLCYTERKDANAAEPGRFSACTVSSCRMEFPDGSESGEIIVYRHRF